MLIIGQENIDSPIEIIADNGSIYAVAFSTDGEHLLSSGDGNVEVWRVEDAKKIATMEVTRGDDVQCLAVSKDGRWIAAGTDEGEVYVWDAETREQVWSHREDTRDINAVDFSSDSTRLVSGSDNTKAAVFDIATRKRVQTLDHQRRVFAAKYSPQGDRIATGTNDSIRVWDSNDGHLLMTIKVGVTPYFNTGLLWSDNHLFTISDSKIKQLEASTESAISEWPVPNGNRRSCIALPKHGKFIACASQRTATFWDTTTHTQFSLIEHTQDIHSVTISPDDRFIAIGGQQGNIIIRHLAHITVRFVIVGSRLSKQFYWLSVVYSPASTGRATSDLGREQDA